MSVACVSLRWDRPGSTQSKNRLWPLGFGGRKIQNDSLKALYPQGVDRLELAQSYGLGDCQLLAPLYALSRNPEGRHILCRMIQVQPNGDYTVTFQPYPQRPILVTHAEARQKPIPKGKRYRPHVMGDPGLRILEIAYARLMKQLHPWRFAKVPDDQILKIYHHPNYDADAASALNRLTGWRPKVYTTAKQEKRIREIFLDVARHPKQYVMVAATRDAPGTDKNKIRQLRAAFAQIATPQESALLARVIQKTFKRADLFDAPWSVDLGGKLPGNHIVAVESVDDWRQEICLRDPHNTEIGLHLSYAQFFKLFKSIMFVRPPVPPPEPIFDEPEGSW